MNIGQVNPARRFKDGLFRVITYGAAIIAIFILIAILWKLVSDGWRAIDGDFLTSMASRFPDRAGIKAPIFGSIYLMILTLLISVPLGVGAAVYLEEFTTARNKLTDLIEANIGNLSGVPSIVYGMLGLAVFVGWMALDTGLLAGALTMSLLILPMVILVSREALKAVPDSYRFGSLALGLTRWQMIFRMVLPSALPGILTGIILALSRAIGETAPLIVVGAVSYVSFLPRDVRSGYTVLPLQIFDWAGRPQKEFHELAAGAILVLMAALLILNLTAIFIRARAEKKLRG